MKIAYATDLHGSRKTLEKLLKAGEKKDVGAVVIGGDVSPGFSIQGQRDFLQKCFLPMLRKFRKTGRKPVLFIMGNDDYSLNFPLIQSAEREGLLISLHGTVLRLEGFYFAGYSFVNDGPLLVRDWVKKEAEIGKDLSSLGIADPKRTVCVFHAPPKGTRLDVIWSGEHVGSVAIREFFLKLQPLLGLHGHIHESRDVTGSIADRVGRTIAINPGNENIILIDLERLGVEEL